jgi:CheY-like chemotaxis protein
MSKTIVLADDSVTIQKVVELTFMDEDYRVVAFGNGDEALSNLYGLSPDVVIADVHMPGATGYEVCRRVKAGHPGVPVLLLVGTFEPFDEQQAKAAGADAFLKKPFDSQELLRLVERLLASRPAAAPPAPARPAALESERTDVLPALALAPEEAPAVLPAPWDADSTAPQPVRPGSETLAVEVPPTVAMPAAASAVATIAMPALTSLPVATGNGRGVSLSDEEIDKVARRVVEILSERIVREVAWEVVPDLAEVVIKDRLRELESQVE